MSISSYRDAPDPPESPEFIKAQQEMEEELQKERARQEQLLMKRAIRLLQKERLTLDDISETFLFRKLLVAAWSTSSTERQWATQQLMGLKGMRPRKADRTISAEDDVRLDELDSLKPV